MNNNEFSDFLNGHPELNSSPETTNNAEQETITSLYNRIESLTSERELRNGRRVASLHYPDQSQGVATVWLIEKGLDRDDPNRVAQIQMRETVEETRKELIFNYFIVDTDEGRFIEKYQQSSPRSEITTYDESGELDIYSSAMKGLESIGELRRSREQERELGLNIVTEEEAKELEAFLSDLVPFKKSY